MGECGTRWRPLLFMRQSDPLCHPLSARGVCLHHCSLYSLYQPEVANEKHQVNTTTRTAMTLNLLIHVDTTNWNPCELHSGQCPFSCKPHLKGKRERNFKEFYCPGSAHLELDHSSLNLHPLPAPAHDSSSLKIKPCWDMLDNHNQIIQEVTCNTKNNPLWIVQNLLVQLVSKNSSCD